jgi:predicted nucleic acid-binding protein
MARTKQKPEEAEATAVAIEALLSSDGLTQGQFNLLTDILLELSNNTGVSVYSPGVVAAFYLTAVRRKGAAGQRNELAEALRLIESGETFNDYIGNDGVRRWKMRRRARAHGSERGIADNLVGAFASTKTPADYRTALCEALQAYAKVAFTKYDESDPRETYLAAASEYAIWPDRPGFHEARLRICDLLYGLRKKRPLDDVPAVREQPPTVAPHAEKQIGELRAKLDGLYEPENEAARFKVEREIYDLTHARVGTEEWSEFVSG